MRNTATNESYSFGAINLCIQDGGSVQVLKVAPVQVSGDPVVRAFAVRDVPTPDFGLFGDSKGTLKELGQGIGSDGEAKGFDPSAAQVVAGPCSTELGQSELAVEVARSTPVTAVISKLAVTYGSTNPPSKTVRTRVFVVPSTLILCAKSDPRTECAE